MIGQDMSQPSRKLYVKNYGCQMNVYDATRMVDVLHPLGYHVTSSLEEADFVILNTCHIREKASEKLYSELGRLQKIKNKRRVQGHETLIGVAGCVAQADGKNILKRAPYVDLVFGPQTYHMLPRMVTQVMEARALGRPSSLVMLDFPQHSKFDFLPEETLDKGPASFLSVQEGCDKFCTYCVVPYTRGVEFSRPIEQITEEARRLVAGGAKEITLLGQNVSAFHGRTKTGEEWGLGALLRHLEKTLKPHGLKRLRYTTSHPNDMQEELIAAHRDVGLLMPFLHLPVQSGSDRLLKAMNRHNTASSYIDLVTRFREAQPGLALSSDFIVGFPGETDEDFEATLTLVRKVQYAQAYSFKYSPRPGTPAAEWAHQVPESEKDARLQVLQKLLNEQQLAFNKACVGQTMDVLFEKKGHKPGQWMGRSPYMQSVHVVSSDIHVGDILPVLIQDGLANSLRGVLATPQHASIHAA